MISSEADDWQPADIQNGSYVRLFERRVQTSRGWSRPEYVIVPTSQPVPLSNNHVQFAEIGNRVVSCIKPLQTGDVGVHVVPIA